VFCLFPAAPVRETVLDLREKGSQFHLGIATAPAHFARWPRWSHPAGNVKALGIDYGEARVGVACSDDLGMLAHPVETIEVRRGDPVRRIAEIAAERKVEAVIIGMPYRLDGSRGAAAAKVERFAAKVAKALPALRVLTQDERLTTTSAQAKLHAAGRTVKSSRAVIDQAAAVEILQDWLDAASP
jgi:putative Holliday junction resolvase